MELGPGLWRWTARHPDWHPGRFGAEVASFALEAGEELLLVDPLLPVDDDALVLGVLDRLAGSHDVHALITIGYHVRSAEPTRGRSRMRWRRQRRSDSTRSGS